MEDKQIIQLFWDRSEDALAAMEQKYGARAQQLARRILGNKQDGEECVNDALQALWTQIPPEQPRNLWAYFSRILRNLCTSRLDYLHAGKRDRTWEICLEELDRCFVTERDAQQHLEAKYISQVINTFLDGLDRTNRIIFVRRFYYFDSCADIAKRVGMSRIAVNTRLSRLREALRKILKKEDISV